MLQIPVFCRYLTVLDDRPYLFQDWPPHPVAIQTNWDIIKTSVKMPHALYYYGLISVRLWHQTHQKQQNANWDTVNNEQRVFSSRSFVMATSRSASDTPALIKCGLFLFAVTPSCQHLWSFYSLSDTESSGFSLGTRGSLVPMVAPICQHWTGYQKLLNKSNMTAKTDISAPYPWNWNKNNRTRWGFVILFFVLLALKVVSFKETVTDV